jgi:drug/metabolite transporter (DMT)-like permease
MKSRGYWLVLMAAILWGTNGTAQALAPEGAQPLVIGALRIVIGGLTLLAIASMRGALRDRKRWSLLPTLVGALSMAAYQVFFFAGWSAQAWLWGRSWVSAAHPSWQDRSGTSCAGSGRASGGGWQPF